MKRSLAGIVLAGAVLAMPGARAGAATLAGGIRVPAASRGRAAAHRYPRRRTGARASARGVFHRQAGRAGSRISALPDVLRPDAARADGRARRAAARCRPRFPPRRDQHRSARHAGRRRGRQGEISRRVPSSRRRKRRAFSDRVGGGGAPDRRGGRLPVPIRRDARPVSSIPPVSSLRARKAGSADTCSVSTDPPPSCRPGSPTAAHGQAFDVLRPILLLCHAAGVSTSGYSVPIMAAFGIANLAAIAVLIAVFAAILRRRRG